MITVQELELLALLLQRAGVTPVEAAYANSILDRLRTQALEQQTKAALEQPTVEELRGTDDAG